MNAKERAREEHKTKTFTDLQLFPLGVELLDGIRADLQEPHALLDLAAVAGGDIVRDAITERVQRVLLLEPIDNLYVREGRVELREGRAVRMRSRGDFRNFYG